MTEAFNVDCMEYMRSVPDKYFDLAVVDPPYGDAGGDLLTRPASASGLTAINRGGWHGKQKYHLGTYPAQERPTAGRELGLRELEEPGRRNMQKNYCVGRSAGAGIL